jgi:uncharacterized protein (TIGR03032 family)
VARGFTMPHSPRVHDGRLWVLDSGKGRLSTIDRQTGREEPVAHLPGFTRGMTLHGSYAFIGLSKIRETSVFGGIPIAEHRERLHCGVHVVDVRTGQTVASLNFHSGVDEIFAVAVLPGVRFAAVSGPNPAADGSEIIWYVPGKA